MPQGRCNTGVNRCYERESRDWEAVLLSDMVSEDTKPPQLATWDLVSLVFPLSRRIGPALMKRPGELVPLLLCSRVPGLCLVLCFLCRGWSGRQVKRRDASKKHPSCAGGGRRSRRAGVPTLHRIGDSTARSALQGGPFGFRSSERGALPPRLYPASGCEEGRR